MFLSLTNAEIVGHAFYFARVGITTRRQYRRAVSGALLLAAQRGAL